jgi:hypothetical protein
VSWLLDAYSDRRTYGSVGYLLLGLPLGIVGFVVVVSGFALGLGLLITLLGVPVLLATLLFVRAYASLERRLAWSMLEAPMPRITPTALPAGANLWERLRWLIGSRRTWRETAFIVLRLPMGIVGFTVVVLIIGLMFGGFAQPITVALGIESQLGDWVIDTIPESLAYLPISIVFLIVGPRIVLGYGSMSARIATAFLGQVDTPDLKAAVTSTLAQTGEAGALEIAHDLELRLGPGPFVTLTQVEAALIALESTGRVRATRAGSDTRYSLSEPGDA